MAVNIVTKEDLIEFRHLLLDDLKNIIHTKPHKQKQWLKSSEVRKLLRISPGTLQNLRINGTLTFAKVGSIIYYNYEDIEAVLESNNTKTTTAQQHNNNGDIPKHKQRILNLKS